MVHGTQYRIVLGNHSDLRCDAQVLVDGKDIGTFRLDAHHSWELERPGHDRGMFTFFKARSAESVAAGEANISVINRGLLTVTFMPERRPQPVVWSASPHGTPESYTHSGSPPVTELTSGSICRDSGMPSPKSLSSGITGLTGSSKQDFTHVSALNYDAAGYVTITLRLVCGSGVRELTQATKGNPIPAAVEWHE
jgi:hypothetical protein